MTPTKTCTNPTPRRFHRRCPGGLYEVVLVSPIEYSCTGGNIADIFNGFGETLPNACGSSL